MTTCKLPGMAMSRQEQVERQAINEAIGRRVASLMKLRGIKGKDLAPHLGMSAGPLSERLNGKTPFKADELATIGRLLHALPAAFFEDFQLDGTPPGTRTPNLVIQGHLFEHAA